MGWNRRFVCRLGLAALVWHLAGCAGMGQREPVVAPVPGWVVVEVPPAGAVRHPQTRTFIDQVVAPLIARGVAPEAITWLKPAYGNQNLAWLRHSPSFAKTMIGQYIATAQSRSEPWEIGQRAVRHGGVIWSSLAMSPQDSRFQLTLYYCQPKGSETPVIIYWGEEGKAMANALQTMVGVLAAECA